MKLVDGITLCHEHMYIDLSGIKENEDCRLDCQEETIKEMREIYGSGVRNIIEVTNIGMGRNLNYIKKIQEETNINFLLSTGFYKEPFLPKEVNSKTNRELADIMIKEIDLGIDNTDIKASIIGEIGTSKNCMTDLEKKVFEASAIAHRETSVPITTHTTLGTYGMEQIQLFKHYGVDLSKVVIGHVDLSGDLDYILRLIDQGIYVQFDTIGKSNYLEENKRVDLLYEIIGRNLEERVLLSVDITRKSHLKYKGGIGYNYLFETFIPMLRERGVKENSLTKILVENPKQLFK
ncbi:phosphotriesterase-related protein [Clostridioides sp. ZZV15-6383]|uniref:phosphotriesterase family protein n=1 Tax=Clostridioides sp. ZZV15-6383 TaxID=2811498 RepID=UPI001D1099EE|nr:phosphotriesterase-related protein [Clostridioides sp. ZZV15-6383]